jgi:hypothetical protein
MDIADRREDDDAHELPNQAASSRTTEDQDVPESAAAAKKKIRKIRRVGSASSGPACAQDGRRPGGGAESYMHFFHFDAQTGKVVYIDDDKNTFGAVCECHKCGTAMQFEAEKCPVCGTRFDEGDTGIVALLGKEGLHWPGPSEMDCPQCGEHVKLVRGMCPECEASIVPSGKAGADERLDRLVSAENVVFVHLDVESGEIEYLQRMSGNRGFGHKAVHIEDTGSDGPAEG